MKGSEKLNNVFIFICMCFNIFYFIVLMIGLLSMVIDTGIEVIEIKQHEYEKEDDILLIK